MTKIKLCGMTRMDDIRKANELRPDYIGFVFAKKSKRALTPEQAAELKAALIPDIQAVGVFVNEAPENVTSLLNQNIIDVAQLHGQEDNAYLATLRRLTDKPLIQAFQIKSREDLKKASDSQADFILLDAGAGAGEVFDWSLLSEFNRPYFLAGGLNPDNVSAAIRQLHPYGVDVSSGLETDSKKDPAKMAAFTAAVRKEDET